MTDWEQLLVKHKESNFLQSETWAKVNEEIGNKFIMKTIGETGLCLMIVKDAKRGRYLEIPGGPLINWKNEKEINEALEEIKKVAKYFKCAFARIRPQLQKTPETLEILKNHKLKPSPMHLAAEHTVIIDLKKPEEALLSEMRRQTRYDIKRASKLGIIVKKDNSEKIFKEFHKVQSETAKRQNFVPPDLKTLLAERSAFLEMGDNIQIYVAKTGSKDIEIKDKKVPKNAPIAYGLVFSHGKEAEYYEAASTPLNLILPGAHALQWQIIKDLKEQGIERYNLWGIAPPNSPHHRYAGVTTFKTGFGGEIVEFVPAHDLIVNHFKYLPNLIIETIRKKRRHL